jgi:hypothetical protein
MSCDPNVTYEFYVKNNCNEEIIINIIDNHDINSMIKIEANTEQIIYRGETFGHVYMEYFFKQIVIIKNNMPSKINYVNHDLWNIRKSTEYIEESYLIITPEDFE